MSGTRDELAAKIAARDWQQIGAKLDEFGAATLKDMISPQDCHDLVTGYPVSATFRSVISMSRHGFGRGEYKYYANPHPAIIQNLRRNLYPRLAPVANRWSERLGSGMDFPPTHEAFLTRCHEAGQTRPTPLILQYVEGIITACIRTFTATFSSRCRWRCFCPNRAGISLAGNSS